jgi:ADP-ribose pyrophosphatase YjhB (NUDIX family)
MGKGRASTKRWLLLAWRWMPRWAQRLASLIVRPRYQVAVAAYIFDPEGRLLLCHHTYRRQFPWGLPGGDLQPGEDPEAAIRREVREETGLRVRVARLLCVENSSEFRHVGLIYLCEGVRGAFVPNEEVDRIQYFDLRSLPELWPDEAAALRRVLRIVAEELK